MIQSDKGLAKIAEGASHRRHAETSPVKVKDTHLINSKLPPAEILCGDWRSMRDESIYGAHCLECNSLFHNPTCSPLWDMKQFRNAPATWRIDHIVFFNTCSTVAGNVICKCHKTEMIYGGCFDLLMIWIWIWIYTRVNPKGVGHHRDEGGVRWEKLRLD